MDDSFFDFGILIQQAVEEALKSPCAKSKRGVALWGALPPSIWGRQLPPFLILAHNGPPSGTPCQGREICGSNCNKIAVHAEERALLKLTRQMNRDGRSSLGASMLHVKVVDGELVPSGPPSCWQCSRMILEAGVASMWLYHEEGWREYPAEEFHRLTLKECGLPG